MTDYREPTLEHLFDMHADLEAPQPIGLTPIGMRQTWIVTGGYSDGTARIADASTGWIQHTLEEHTRPITAVAVSPDGQWIVTGSDDQTARIWDTSTGRQIGILEAHTAGITSVAISRDGRWIVTGSGDQTARLWDASTRISAAALRWA